MVHEHSCRISRKKKKKKKKKTEKKREKNGGLPAQSAEHSRLACRCPWTSRSAGLRRLRGSRLIDSCFAVCETELRTGECSCVISLSFSGMMSLSGVGKQLGLTGCWSSKSYYGKGFVFIVSLVSPDADQLNLIMEEEAYRQEDEEVFPKICRCLS